MVNKEVLNKTIEVENDLIVITEEIKTKKDRRTLEYDLVSIQRQMDNITEQNKRLIGEYQRLHLEKLSVQDMINQLPTDDLEIIR